MIERPWSPGSVVRRAATALLLALLWLYRRLISPLLGARCRFEPSCSAYAEAAIRHYGPLVGSARAIGRLLRCHPFHPGGYDPPVPDDSLKGEHTPHG
jgi:putative membrane protein insertion efficiency factor